MRNKLKDELKGVGPDDLMYVKRLDNPSKFSFYDLIIQRLKKGGPLFRFDVADDVRLGPIDSREEG